MMMIPTCSRSDEQSSVRVRFQVLLILVLSNLLLTTGQSFERDHSGEHLVTAKPFTKCHDSLGHPQRCVPEFVNAAYKREVEVTNTCGLDGPMRYCFQTGPTDETSLLRLSPTTCDFCDDKNTSYAHPSVYLTDANDNNVQTWWQSQTMFDGVQNPNSPNNIKQVNLTIHLGKTFDVTYVRLKFFSPRPASFAIYKKMRDEDEWMPFQFYSYNCMDTYSTPDRAVLSRENETKALCTSEFSDISPLTGANVLFTTLEGRPSARDFENSRILQDFITTTSIRITLDKMNTFGEEIFFDENVLQSYFYAIYDLSVGGICKCNGHASECITAPGDDPLSQSRRLVCNCEHFTTGVDCQECLPFYNDQPWKRADALSAHECRPCNCNGRSNRCYFDQELWQRTGHGGHCLECSDNFDGPNCDRCKENYFQTMDGRCLACNCDPIGSINLQCNSQGQCMCKPGIEGQRCDKCAPNHYDFSSSGCKSCGCNDAGSWNNTATCDTLTGQCKCKPNVEGTNCNLCRPGHFDLTLDNDFGCIPCFCYGHSSVCRSAIGYSKDSVDSMFSRDSEKWTTATKSGDHHSSQYNMITRNIGVKSHGRDALYFIAPSKYLGDQKSSYNQFLTFTLRIGEEGPRATFEDVLLEGAGMTVSQPIFGQGNPLPSTKSQSYRFRLHEDATLYGWSPRLRAKDFMSVLANLTAIKIRGTYTYDGSGFIDDVKLETAVMNNYGSRASWVEMCTCPQGYIGQFCESCAPGFRHDPPGGGSFSQCVPCNCNGHADLCDDDSGACICRDNTAGINCERCSDGFYGNALAGTENDCAPCPCPEGGACLVLPEELIACTQCPPGYGGLLCDQCVDNHYGDPKTGVGVGKLCRECDCNGNVDPNAFGNCNTTSGDCLKCIFNTHGSRCEKCLPGFYGDALAYPKGNCKPCGCNHLGTVVGTEPAGFTYDTSFTCESNGKCKCKPKVDGRACDRCADGFFNLESGQGCESCDCNLIGSFNRTCDARTGQCHCRPGVTGKHCDQCLPLHYGFSMDGCRACDCDGIGSTSAQCDDRGQCPCKTNVEGRRCERCRENKHDKQAGCVDCPVCYNLIQDAVDEQRRKLTDLEKLLQDIEQSPQTVDDVNFNQQLEDIVKRVQQLLREATRAQGADGSLIVQLENLKARTQKVRDMGLEVKSRLKPIDVIVQLGSSNITMAEETIDTATETLAAARRYLDTEGYGALNKAKDRSRRFGQQSERMSEIAKQARHLADRHEEEAGATDKLAREAIATSETAYKLALDAIQTQETNRLALKKLESQLDELSELMQRTSKMATDAKKEAAKANSDAVAIFTDINSISVPNFQSDRLRIEALDLIGQAENILKEAFDLLRKNADALNTTQYQQQEARDLLAEANRQQALANDLLFEVTKSLAKANESIHSGESTLDDAKKTLATLQGFDRLVQESKAKAEDALRKVVDIKRLIEEAEGKTEEAENALRGALEDANEAMHVALEAQKIAEKASEDATRIRAEADTTRNRASKLKADADGLSLRVEDTARRMKEFEDQAANDAKLANDALERANQAKTSAADADAKVNGALDTVKGIMTDLDQVQEIDSGLLEELERRLEEAEKELTAANLDQRLLTLKTAREVQQAWIRNYDAEIEQLKKDVANVQEIRHAIPEQCFRRVRLEP